jgi:hypothetical protein
MGDFGFWTLSPKARLRLRQAIANANGYAQCKFWILDTIAKGEAVPTAGYRQRQRLRNAKGKAVANSASFGSWIEIQILSTP